MTIDEAQAQYDNRMPEDHECEECCKLIDRNDALADKLRERDDEILRLQELLTKNNICFDED